MATPIRAVRATPRDPNLPPMDERATPPPATPAIPQVTHEELRAGAERRSIPVTSRAIVQEDDLFPPQGRSAPENTRRAPRSTRLTPEQQAKADLLKTAVERVLDQHRNGAGCFKRLFIYLFGRIAYKAEIKKQKGVEGKSLETLQAAAKNLAKQEASRHFPSKEEFATARIFVSPSHRAIHAEHLRIEDAIKLFREAFEQRVQVLQLDVNHHHCEVAFALVETAFKGQRIFAANRQINPTHKPTFVDKVLQNQVDTFAQQSLTQIAEDYFDFTAGLTTRFPDSFSPENPAVNQLHEAIRKAHPNVTEYDDAITTLRRFQADPNYLPQRVRAELYSIREELTARLQATQEELRATETILARLRGEQRPNQRTIQKGEQDLARLRQAIEASFTEIRAHDARIDEEKEKGKRSLLEQINILTHLRDQIAPPRREPAPNNTTSHRHRGVPPSINASHRRERAPPPSPSVLPAPIPPLPASNQPLQDPGEVDISLKPRWVRLSSGGDLMFFQANDGKRIIVSSQGTLFYDTPDQRGNWIETGVAAPDPRLRQQIVPTPEDIRKALDSAQIGEVIEGEVLGNAPAPERPVGSPSPTPLPPPAAPAPAAEPEARGVPDDQLERPVASPRSRSPSPTPLPPPAAPAPAAVPFHQQAKLPDGKLYNAVEGDFGLFYAKDTSGKIFSGTKSDDGSLCLSEEVQIDQLHSYIRRFFGVGV